MTQRPDFSRAGKAFADEMAKYDKKEPTNVYDIIGKGVIIFALLILSAIIGSVVWNWLIPPLFPAIPELNVGEAFALRTVIMTFIPSSSNEDKFDMSKTIVMTLTRYTFILLVALLAKQFV